MTPNNNISHQCHFIILYIPTTYTHVQLVIWPTPNFHNFHNFHSLMSLIESDESDEIKTTTTTTFIPGRMLCKNEIQHRDDCFLFVVVGNMIFDYLHYKKNIIFIKQQSQNFYFVWCFFVIFVLFMEKKWRWEDHNFGAWKLKKLSMHWISKLPHSLFSIKIHILWSKQNTNLI